MTKRNLCREEFLTECNNALWFLVEKHHFSGPEVDADSNLVHVSFFKGDIAIQCILDEREEDVSVKVVRLEHGKKPNVYRTNEKGEVVREYLTQLLIRRGIRDIKFDDSPNFRQLSKRRANYRKALKGYAGLLQKYGKDILDGSSRIFELST